MSYHSRILVPVLAAAALLVARSPRAAADDAAAQVAAIVAEIDAAEKAKNEDGVQAGVKKVAPAYKATQDAALRGSLLKAAMSVVKNAKFSTPTRKMALTALVETEDGPACWKVMSGAYPKDDAEDPEKFNQEYVKAVGALHPDGAVDVLLETFRKAKVPDVSANAVTGLGNYGKSKHREKILAEVAKAAKNMIPSRSATKNPSKEAQDRWQAVGPAIGTALDTLTGQKVGDVTEWIKRVDEAKNNLKSLFRNKEGDK